MGANNDPSILTKYLKDRSGSQGGRNFNRELYNKVSVHPNSNVNSSVLNDEFSVLFRNKNSSVRNIVSKGQLNHSEIDQIIKNSLIYPGSGPGHLLRDLEKMLNQNPQGINHILGNIKTPNRSNFLGAEWVLRYICDGANPQRLRGLSRLELPTAGGSRIYDAVINGIRYEFKNLQTFNSSGFMTQIAKDFRNDPTLSSVRWIYSSRVGDKADLIAQMRQSLRNRSLLSANNLTRAQGRSIIAELDNFVDVGIKL